MRVPLLDARPSFVSPLGTLVLQAPGLAPLFFVSRACWCGRFSAAFTTSSVCPCTHNTCTTSAPLSSCATSTPFIPERPVLPFSCARVPFSWFHRRNCWPHTLWLCFHDFVTSVSAFPVSSTDSFCFVMGTCTALHLSLLIMGTGSPVRFPSPVDKTWMTCERATA